ncbi:MAG: hypothetical protein ACN6I3_00020 [bacterium]
MEKWVILALSPDSRPAPAKKEANMNNQNLLYALLGGSIVTLAWAVSVALTVNGLWVGLSVYAIAAAILVAVQDYTTHSKSLR